MGVTEQSKLDLHEHLMPLDISKFYKQQMIFDDDRKRYGFIPMMALCSAGQLAALMSESFCMYSCANDVLVNGNTLLSNEQIEMLVLLRVNRAFMK